MDLSDVINAIAAAGICACAGMLFRISMELAGLREWRKYVDRTLAEHDKVLKK